LWKALNFCRVLDFSLVQQSEDYAVPAKSQPFLVFVKG